MSILLVFVGLYNDVVAYPDKHASYSVPVRLPVLGSVQTFVVSLTSVLTSRLATLRLTKLVRMDASRRYPSV